MLDVRNNFKNKYIKKSNNTQLNTEALLCQLCKHHVDNAENIFQCTVLANKLNSDNIKNSKFEDLFSKDMKIVSYAIKLFAKLWKIRQQKMNEDKNN